MSIRLFFFCFVLVLLNALYRRAFHSIPLLMWRIHWNIAVVLNSIANRTCSELDFPFCFFKRNECLYCHTKFEYYFLIFFIESSLCNCVRTIHFVHVWNVLRVWNVVTLFITNYAHCCVGCVLFRKRLLLWPTYSSHHIVSRLFILVTHVH